MVKRTFEEFVDLVRKKQTNNNLCFYIKDTYVNMNTKMLMKCNIHGEFWQSPKNHLKKCQCPKCSNIYKYDTEEFIERAIKVHKDRYQYHLVEYINSITKVQIYCPLHGIFWQTPAHHLSGSQCPGCTNNKKLDFTEFVRRAFEIHGNKYIYDLVEYNGMDKKVQIFCPLHGIFWQTPSKHIGKREGGCPKCNGGVRHTLEEFIKMANDVHENMYQYHLVEYINSNTKVKIWCPIHGIFEQTPGHHLSGIKCPRCKTSKGEIKITHYLNELNISFTTQKIFDDCVYKKSLPFDFFIPHMNLCIEYDGEQHFKIVERWGGLEGFELRKIRDDIKTNFCKNNNINLLRISYEDNIENKLKEYGFGL